MGDAESPHGMAENRDGDVSAVAAATTVGALAGPPGRARRSWLATGLKLSIGFGLLAYLILSGRLRVSAFSNVRLGWEVAAMAALVVGALFLPCIRWQVLLRYQGIEVPFGRAVKLTWIGYFFGLVLPGAVSGDLVRGYYIVKDSPRARAKAASTIIVDRGLGLYSLFFIGLIPALVLHGRGQVTGVVRGMTLVTLALALGLTAGLALLCHPTSRRWCLRLLPSRVGDQIGSILSDYCSRPVGLAACFAISLGANLLNVLAFIPAALALGERLSALSVLLAGPLIILANSLPISPGGLGVGESTSHALLDSFGFAYGAEVMLLLRAAILASALPGAALYAVHAGRGR